MNDLNQGLRITASDTGFSKTNQFNYAIMNMFCPAYLVGIFCLKVKYILRQDFKEYK